MLFVRRTRHTLRSAEFGFFGVVVYTRRHTPRFCGQERSAGDAVRVLMTSLPRRISCCTVGISKKNPFTAPGEMSGPVLGEREGSRDARDVKRCLGECRSRRREGGPHTPIFFSVPVHDHGAGRSVVGAGAGPPADKAFPATFCRIGGLVSGAASQRHS